MRAFFKNNYSLELSEFIRQIITIKHVMFTGVYYRIINKNAQNKMLTCLLASAFFLSLSSISQSPQEPLSLV